MYSLLRHTATIQQKTSMQTAIGTFSATWIDRATVKCLIQPTQLSETTETGRVTVRNGYKMFCLPTTITESDRVVWNSKSYEVTGIRDAAGQGHHLEIDLEVIE